MFYSQNELPCIFEHWQYPSDSERKVKIMWYKESEIYDYEIHYNSIGCSIDLQMLIKSFWKFDVYIMN